MMSMINLEDHLKAILSDIIGQSFGVDHQKYLARNNYRDKPVTNPKFSRNEILYTLSNTALRSRKEPIKHYREKYGIVPPWILFKDTYFATIVNLIRFLKGPERNKLMYRLYGDQITQSNIEAYKDLLSDTLFICLDYRNQAAHGGRIYNYIPKSILRPFNELEFSQGLPQLIASLGYLNYEIPLKQIDKAISRAINHYCNTYPTKEDIDRLSDATGFTIARETRVWANEKTKTYHSNQHCSGSHNLKSTLYDEALSSGYSPCKRCFVKNSK